MDNKKMQDSAIKEETPSICSQLNLDITKLNIETLMSNATYRRLYNIVKNDMSRSELSFRKNLIKELYFLLQITPIIRPQLIDNFLGELEKWYNLNDHKKIDLASNKLNSLLNIVHAKKDSIFGSTCDRPKSGITWNQNVSPFLRPYTAKRPESSKNGKSTRPESSKFGQKSTKMETIDDYCIREFTTNTQEQIQISQDFLQKHRTTHPQIQPIYEQLYNILKKIESPVDQEPIIVGKSIAPKAARYVKSAFCRKQKETVKQVEVQSQQNILNEEQPQNIQIDEDNEQKQERQRQDSEDSSSEQEQYLYINEKKPYKAYNQTMKEYENSSNKPTQQIQHLQKYDHIMDNKLVQALREDCQMAEGYVNFARAKSAMRREHNRRNESRRLMSGKLSVSSSVKFIKRNIPLKEDDQKQNATKQKTKIIDLTKDRINLKPDAINPYPTYNKRQLLRRLYQEPVKLFKKRNNIDQIAANIKQNVNRPMTSFVRFHSPVRFDPMSDQNIKKYNQQILDEIEQIKMKVGGKCYASTESLMRALIVDTIDKDELPKWETKNPYFGLNSIGKAKKLKKKGKKHNPKATLAKN